MFLEFVSSHLFSYLNLYLIHKQINFRLAIIKDSFLPFMGVTWVTENSLVAGVSITDSLSVWEIDPSW